MGAPRFTAVMLGWSALRQRRYDVSLPSLTDVPRPPHCDPSSVSHVTNAQRVANVGFTASFGSPHHRARDHTRRTGMDALESW